ncbi:hypothetical protein CsatB_006791 [Cannabis sativa]
MKSYSLFSPSFPCLIATPTHSSAKDGSVFKVWYGLSSFSIGAFFSRVVMEHSHMETYSLEPEDRKRMFIFGMGFVGHCFAQQLKSQGWDVFGTCTSIVKKKKQLADWGFDNGIYHFDANEPE